jgi:hypothetical protein
VLGMTIMTKNVVKEQQGELKRDFPSMQDGTIMILEKHITLTRAALLQLETIPGWLLQCITACPNDVSNVRWVRKRDT